MPHDLAGFELNCRTRRNHETAAWLVWISPDPRLRQPRLKDAEITQLDGEPNFNPDGLATRSHSQYAEGQNLTEMIKEDLVAERIAIETYSEIIRWLANDDPTTRIMIEQINKAEEEHANDMADLLKKMS